MRVGAFARCEGEVCESGLGFDEQGSKVFRVEGKVGLDPDKTLGGRGSIGLFSFENEDFTMDTFTASADLYREKEGDTMRYGIGAGATAVGGSYKRIPLPVGEQTEMIFGCYIGLGLGLEVTRQKLPGGRSLYTSVASFGPFTFGLKGVE